MNLVLPPGVNRVLVAPASAAGRHAEVHALDLSPGEVHVIDWWGPQVR